MTEEAVDAGLAVWRASAPVIVAGAPVLCGTLLAALTRRSSAQVLAGVFVLVWAAATIENGVTTALEGVGGARIAGLVSALLAVIGAMTVWSASALQRREGRETGPHAIAAMLAACGVFQGLVLLAQSPVDVFIYLECAGVCAVIMAVTCAPITRSMVAAALNAAVMFGVGGVLIAVSLALSGGPLATAVGGVLLVVGFLMRTGVAPFHAPIMALLTARTQAAALLIGAGLCVSVIAMTPRILGFVGDGRVQSGVAVGMATAAAIGVVWSAMQAAGAQDLRRFTASAVAAQFGAALIGFASPGAGGVAAGFVHLVAATAIAAGLIYAGAAAAKTPNGPLPLSDLDGLGRRRPMAAAAMTAAGLSVVGAPLTAGFLSKWLLIQAALAQGWWPAAVALVIASLVVIVPVGALIERLYFTAPDESAPSASLSSVSLAPVLGLSFVVTLALGLNAAHLVEWANHAAAALRGAP